MGMVVRTNSMAMNANRNLNINSSQVSKSLQKLSSGYKINSAADDAAGLAISEKMKSQIAGLDQASANAQDGISLVQTAEGATSQIHSMLNRMKTLATKSSNGTIQDEVDREAIQSEVDALNTEITRISKSTNFNGITLMDGSLGGAGVSDGTKLTGANIVSFTTATTGTKTAADMSGTGVSFTADTETLNIDGVDITVDWSKLSKEDQDALNVNMTTGQSGTSMEKIASIIEKTVNAAIDETNKQTGSKVDHIKVKGTANNGAGSLKFTSGADDTKKSNITFKGTTKGAVPGGTAKFGKGDGAYLAATLGITAAGNTSTFNSTNKLSPDATDINDISFDMSLGGEKLNLKVTGLTTGTSTIDEVATALNTAIQNALDNYATAKGLNDEDKAALKANIQVGATDDGRLAVTNNSDMTISFSDKDDNKAASLLGIAKGQAGVNNGGLTLQIGDTADDFNKLTVSIDDLSAAGIGTENLDVSTMSAAGNAIETIQNAINTVSTNRANLGAVQNRLEYTIENLDNTSENISSANSAIRDTDMAKQMMEYTQSNILMQAAQSMLAQANSAPQQVLQLLQ